MESLEENHLAYDLAGRQRLEEGVPQKGGTYFAHSYYIYEVDLFSLGNLICVWVPGLALPQQYWCHLFPHPLEAFMTLSLLHLNDPGVDG